MATELERTVRQNWAWRKRGKARWLPLPIDTFTLREMYLIQGFYWLVTCTESDFEKSLVEDLDNVFFNTDEFASKGIYTNVDGNSYELTGIFDDPYEESNPDTTIGLQSIHPQFKCELADIIDGVRKNDSIKICVRGTNRRFKIIESQPDGTGLTVLMLHQY